MAKRGHRPSTGTAGRPRMWGRHPIMAALANPNRVVRKLWGTREALAALDLPADMQVTFAEAPDLGRMVPADAPHQGLVAEVDPLDDMWLADLLMAGREDPDDQRPLVVLDQVTDPHNVGAILRSAAAFNALGIVTQDRHSPPESGTVARAASGALGGQRICIVLGAEGEGMRQNTEAHCDELAKLPISGKVESLNVSNAAAIALYAVVAR
jgi:23S rRNA (guanosine2251-2'-O)-methyltransferase